MTEVTIGFLHQKEDHPPKTLIKLASRYVQASRRPAFADRLELGVEVNLRLRQDASPPVQRLRKPFPLGLLGRQANETSLSSQ